MSKTADESLASNRLGPKNHRRRMRLGLICLKAETTPTLHCSGMEAEADKLRGDLQRYRRLLSPFGGVTDRQVRNTLKELIAETETRLHAIERAAVADKPLRSV